MGKAAKILREHGCWLLYLPPYSPDLNPIEVAFTKLKAHLRSIGARTFDQLPQAIGSICDMFTPEECWNYFIKAGYSPQLIGNAVKLPPENPGRFSASQTHSRQSGLQPWPPDLLRTTSSRRISAEQAQKTIKTAKERPIQNIKRPLSPQTT